ncbi:MAG: hypothetical protein IH631_01820, partial [Candidatus Thorarchaeota archaeon]|nr:hypothetical protein [Candidatus Thorarchaeota archaeon]
MTEENESPSVLSRMFIAAILATILAGIVSTIVMVVPWITIDWYFSTLFISFFPFFVGCFILLGNTDSKFWTYSFIAGLLIDVGSILLATSLLLYSIQVPIFGNALNIAIMVIVVIAVVIFCIRSSKQEDKQTGQITTSAKSLAEQTQSIQRIFMQGKPETILALELVEEPHDYIFSDNEDKSPSVPIERFSSLVRTLFSTPFIICYQQHNFKMRVYFMTWSKDEVHISQQRTVLLDAIQYNLPSFKFEVIDTFAGIELGEHEKGSAAIITGVPLTVEDESQSKDPLESIVGVLRELENGIFQIFVEPAHLSKSNLKKLEEQYKSEVMRSETVISKERSGLLQGKQQESRTSVNMEARKKA